LLPIPAFLFFAVTEGVFFLLFFESFPGSEAVLLLQAHFFEVNLLFSTVRR